jgi:hypothetical protein
MEQILNLLTSKERCKTFKEYLDFLKAEIKDITNPYEAARFTLRGETCVIYYKETKGRFSFSNTTAETVYLDWKLGNWIKIAKKKRKKDKISETQKAKTEIYKILGNLMEDFEFRRYMKFEFDRAFHVEDLRSIEEARIAYKCIQQYRRVFLKEVKQILATK